MFAVTKIQIFESNSQLCPLAHVKNNRCSPSQRYKFLKAIHNFAQTFFFCLCDVRRHKDTNFWKQFTTMLLRLYPRTLMFAVTKIQIFESNSQRLAAGGIGKIRCSPSQRYKFLKAIHNCHQWQRSSRLDVRRHKDTNFWKQFTTSRFFFIKILRCSPSQRYKFLKAIHNCLSAGSFFPLDVRRHKDTNFWKQFTTVDGNGIQCAPMFAVTKIQIFESNSQRSNRTGRNTGGCSPSQRYKFLKAIHNLDYFVVI